MSTALKLLLSLLSDEKSRKKILLIVGSIITGLVGMLLLPFVVLAELNQLDPPKIQLNEAEIQPIFDMDKLTESEAECNEIAEMLIHKGNRYQALKAQLIYLSYSDSGKITDLDEYTNIFYIDDDGILIDCLNTFYALEIDKEAFQRTYLLVKNATIDPYLFTNPKTKNSTDLTAWCRNAYESGWLSDFGRGEINPEKQWRTADNVGLILGYLNYLPEERAFGTDMDTLFYAEQGTLDTMPEVAGIGVFSGSEFGVYDGNGQVFLISDDEPAVQKISVSDSIWKSWVTYEGIDYPQRVWDRINELNAPPEEPEQNGP